MRKTGQNLQTSFLSIYPPLSPSPNPLFPLHLEGFSAVTDLAHHVTLSSLWKIFFMKKGKDGIQTWKKHKGSWQR